jgi:hypothetical protein
MRRRWSIGLGVEARGGVFESDETPGASGGEAGCGRLRLLAQALDE